MTQLLLEKPQTVTPEYLDNPAFKDKTAFNDDSIPESVFYFSYEEVDFDGELDMPNLSALVQKLNLWRRNSTEAQTNPNLAAHQKGIPFRSHGRVLSDHFLKVMLYKVRLCLIFTLLFLHLFLHYCFYTIVFTILSNYNIQSTYNQHTNYLQYILGNSV